MDGILQLHAAHGDALDAINREGMRFVRALGFSGAATAKMATAYLGWEQEFFIISKESFLKRPDLVNCGRVLIGAPCSRNQQVRMLTRLVSRA